jgi:hypothetical protein
MRHWEETRFVFFKISIRRKIRQCSSVSQKDLIEDDFLKLTFTIKHCRSKMINQLKKIDKIEIIQKNASKIVQCDTCAISKMHRLIQQTSSTKATKFFQILHFDLIICNKTFDETTCIAHFIDELIFFNWVYSLINHKKKTLLSIFKDLINQCDRIKFNERAIIRIVRINQEIFIDKKLKYWMRTQKINWDWSTKNIFENNENFERFDELLIEKTKCIKEHAKSSKDFYSECYLVATHILNRTSSSSLSWNSSLIFHAKIAEKINSKWDCSSQNVWLQSVFTFQRDKCTQKKWKDEVSSIHRIFDKV